MSRRVVVLVDLWRRGCRERLGCYGKKKWWWVGYGWDLSWIMAVELLTMGKRALLLLLLESCRRRQEVVVLLLLMLTVTAAGAR